MNKKLLLIAAAFAGISGLYVLVMRDSPGLAVDYDHDSDARWANEGGANAPPTV